MNLNLTFSEQEMEQGGLVPEKGGPLSGRCLQSINCNAFCMQCFQGYQSKREMQKQKCHKE